MPPIFAWRCLMASGLFGSPPPPPRPRLPACRLSSRAAFPRVVVSPSGEVSPQQPAFSLPPEKEVKAPGQREGERERNQ